MTREKAIETLSIIKAYEIDNSIRGAEDREAIEMAIQALEQEPCGDAISRQAALNALSTWDKFGCDADTKLVPYKDHYIPYIHYDDVIKCIKGLPSVSTEKTGRWITQWNPVHQKEYYYCSECREEYSYDGETGIKMNNYNYCPNCGAKMEVEE